MKTSVSLFIFFLVVFAALPASAQRIINAVRTGNIDSVKTLLGINPLLINEKDNLERTPLHWAARNGNLEVLKLLLEKNADVNLIDKDKCTPLVLALYNEKRDVVKVLIDAGTDVNLSNIFAMSALHYTIRFKYAIESALIINKGADLNAKIYDGKTSVHLACQGGRSEILKILLEKGAKADLKDSGGNYPIHNAVYFGDKIAVGMLIDHKADINAKNGFGRTPLHQAAASGYAEVTRILIENGAEAKLKDNNGKTPLDLAIEHNNEKSIELLSSGSNKKKNIPETITASSQLKGGLEPGEAIIWHLGNCGWAVKTKNKLLVFDYWNYGEKPEEPSLSNGHISWDEIKNLDVYFFVSHSHYDHYDKSIFDFKGSVKKIKYIFGWKALDNPEYICLTENQLNNVINGVEISNICDNSGSGFLVKTDGIAIFHGGDYAGNFPADHEFLSKKQDRVDILFNNYEYQKNICLNAIEKMKPVIMFPMHNYGCEYSLQMQAKEISEKYPQTSVIAIEDRGDNFFYSKGVIKLL